MAFVLVTITVSGVALRLRWSGPVLLVVVGGIASFIPGLPSVEVDSELVMYGLLPPLLFAAASQTFFADVRARRDSVLILSVGTVAATVVVVGLATALVLPTIGLAAAFAFAAVVAPTDTVAVTAVASRIGLPRRVTTILEGESLLNDAAALVALSSAILAMTQVLTPWSIAGDFALAVVGGTVIGVVVGWVMTQLRFRLATAVLDTSLAFVTPYLAFFGAEAMHGSGVLAVVIAGLYLGYRSPVVQSAEARTAESVNWRTVQFILENAVFLFIGMNLASIVAGAGSAGHRLWQSVLICVVILVALVVARFAFIFAIAVFFRVGPRRFRDQNVRFKNALVISVIGVRGVVTLAAVFLLPAETPNREFLQFLAFVVVVVTLLGSLALPPLIRLLHLPPPDIEQERVEWQTLMAEARAAGLARLEAAVTEADEERVVSQLRGNAALTAESIARHLETPDLDSLLESYARLRRQMIQAEWEATIHARAEGRFTEAAVIAVLRVIDAEEIALRSSAPGLDQPRSAPRQRQRRRPRGA
ncbi:cation:proton antiporter [Conyzicola nivalis]|uniref:cation:proton antiporter n=1 Tax=Conyzicola nivalis TaxID=1477021 RepID=UPI001E39E5B3|nr:cation:proton antiporter [Conyzicola nivalis]